MCDANKQQQAVKNHKAWLSGASREVVVRDLVVHPAADFTGHGGLVGAHRGVEAFVHGLQGLRLAHVALQFCGSGDVVRDLAQNPPPVDNPVAERVGIEGQHHGAVADPSPQNLYRLLGPNDAVGQIKFNRIIFVGLFTHGRFFSTVRVRKAKDCALTADHVGAL